ncbi:DUF1217 domain-containing protein [Roseococcus sp. SYP-B2431]|uniref:DUF1217 domain-containing protein n=1 Tax=Roseococcus sp. SYP-B2431 TaxID=2496640 RepID=UPI00103FAC1B|nr:DUF1217 domain-containing protein [Roseococcus sp. SYP-B2431]TCH98649.1 DUF1217 domain-containing protein [Roseococcus sp. SYP-B2431]
MGDVGGAIAALRRALQPGEEAKALARIATEPMQKRAMDQFQKAVAKAPDIRTALKDQRVLQVVATALGIPDGASRPGLAVQALLSDPKDTKSLVNRLADTRWKAAAEALQLGTKGLDALRDPKVQATLKEGLQRARWQDDLETKQAGLGDAVVFQERAAAVDGNVYAVLGDPVLRRVITGALGLPESIAVQPVETQARAVQARLKLDKLDNPREVQRLAERYLANVAMNEAGISGASSLALLGWPGAFSA